MHTVSVTMRTMDAIVTSVKIIQNERLSEAFEMVSSNGGGIVSVVVVVVATEKRQNKD